MEVEASYTHSGNVQDFSCKFGCEFLVTFLGIERKDSMCAHQQLDGKIH